MREVIFVDDNGFTRRAFVRDNDGDEMARLGIPAGPPNLDELDWESLKREINNTLANNGLFTWKDIQGHPVGLSCICTVLKRRVSGLFREQEKAERLVRESSQIIGNNGSKNHS